MEEVFYSIGKGFGYGVISILVGFATAWLYGFILGITAVFMRTNTNHIGMIIQWTAQKVFVLGAGITFLYLLYR